MERRKCPNKKYMDKGSEAGMRKIEKDLQNENQRFYVGVKWITSWYMCRGPTRQGLAKWAEALWTWCGWWTNWEPL